MIRWLVALASVLAVLVLIEDYAVERQRQHDALHGTLRPLATVNKANVAGIVAVAGNGRTWRYIRVDSTWRYPAYFDAFVQPQRIDHLLNSLLQASASVVSSESRNMQRYGLLPNSPKLTLRNPSNSTLLSIRLGRGVPDIRSAESYVQLVGADTIYHLHANPAHAFDSGDPPMLDLRVRPRALKRKAINRISFSGYPNLKTLYREQREMEIGSMPGAPPSGPIYAWIGAFADGTRDCVTPSAYAYVSFLDRLSWSALIDPTSYAEGFDRALFLVDEDGTVDTLDVGATTGKTTTLRYRTTGQMFTVPSTKANLLFPSEDVLLDSLSKPDPYEQIEPYTPF